jgi:hypothetical protein
VIQLAWVIPYLLLSILLIRYLVVSLPSKANVVFYSIVLVALYFTASMAILLLSSIMSEVSSSAYMTVKYQLHTYLLLLFTLRPFQTRQLVTTASIIMVVYVAEVFLNTQLIEV